MPHSPFKPSHGYGDRKIHSASSKNVTQKAGRCHREQVLELFGPATKERFSPMRDGKCSSGSSSTSSSSSKTSKSDQTTAASEYESHNTKRNKKGYPYHGSFVVDMENEPDYYGTHSKRAHKADKKNADISNSKSHEVQKHDSVKELPYLQDNNSKTDKNRIQTDVHNIPDSKPNYPWISPNISSTIRDKRSSFKRKGMSFNETRWRRWIFAAVLILIFFTMVCIILAYVLQQTKIYEETIDLLNELKTKLDKCCFERNKVNRSDTVIGTEKIKRN